MFFLLCFFEEPLSQKSAALIKSGIKKSINSNVNVSEWFIKLSVVFYFRFQNCSWKYLKVWKFKELFSFRQLSIL